MNNIEYWASLVNESSECIHERSENPNDELGKDVLDSVVGKEYNGWEVYACVRLSDMKSVGYGSPLQNMMYSLTNGNGPYIVNSKNMRKLYPWTDKFAELMRTVELETTPEDERCDVDSTTALIEKGVEFIDDSGRPWFDGMIENACAKSEKVKEKFIEFVDMAFKKKVYAIFELEGALEALSTEEFIKFQKDNNLT